MPLSDDDFLRQLPQLLRLDIETGKLFWLPRAGPGWWNTRFAGQEALITTDAVGYREGRLNGRKYLAHRIVWALLHGEWPAGQIDHINRDRADNRPANLRSVDGSTNCRNKSLQRNNSSGVTGVCWNAVKGKWQVNIRANGQCKHLGLFDDLEDARAAREAGDRRYGYHPSHGKVAA